MERGHGREDGSLESENFGLLLIYSVVREN